MGAEEIWRKAKRALIESYREAGLRSQADVRLLVENGFYEPHIGTKHNCGQADHVAPSTFVEDVLLCNINDYIVWANRSGSKSYLAGLITWVKSSFTPKLETVILGGSMEQSEKSYRAMTSFWDITDLQSTYLTDAPNQRTTEWRNGSRVHILTASTRSTRGPHPQALVMDEIDEMDEDVYTSALSQPQSKFGIKASIGKLSTNHHIGGVMDKAIERAKETHTRLYKWCIWESLQSCRDYSCSTCQLTSYCPGKHMKEADGYYSVEDFINKLYHLSELTLQLEWFCIKAGRDDLVYGAQYDAAVHSPASLPDFDPNKKVILSMDWGGTSPFSVGAWQDFTKDGWGWVRVDELYISNTTNPRVIDEVKSRTWWKNAKEMVADPSRPDLISEWKETGLSVYKADNLVDAGIEAVRNALAPVLGRAKFFVNRKCRHWLTEIGQYAERNGKPVKENDHAMDETRYFVKRYIRPARIVRARRIG